jgi:tRNA(fMet)-specific endonuclease VapC
MKVLIDTNAYSALMRGDGRIADLLDSSELVYLSTIVAGELLAGFKGGARERQNRACLEDFIRRGGKTALLPVRWDSAERFAQIMRALRTKGRPLPINDVWIAAQCLETGAMLVTMDAHFQEIDGLLIWDLEG